MTALRRHVVVLFALCVALAAGVALGTGLLNGRADDTGERSLRSTNVALRDRVANLQRSTAFAEQLTASLAPDLLDGRLAGRNVTVLVLPGVRTSVVDATREIVETAGGTVAVEARIRRALVDPARKTYVDSVATSSSRDVSDLPVTTSAQTYDRIGALLARAYAANAGRDRVDEEATSLDSELQGAKLVALDAEPLRRGSLVVVLADGHHGTDSHNLARTVIVNSVVAQLAQGSDGVLVAAPATASSRGGLIDALAKDEALGSSRVATLNVVDSAAGRTALVYALLAAAAGVPGHYGVTPDGEVVLPPGLGAPAR